MFLDKGGFPCIAGCIVGTLVNIDAPSINEEQFIDRHGKHSINVTMVCGPNHVFYALYAKWPGSVHDARVLRNTSIFVTFESGWQPFPGAVLLGDNAYALKEWLIPPRHQNSNDEIEQRFNRKHKFTRRLIECSCGILKERFPCLNYCL
ncbi:putative nuclease HARBI1 [Sipha flava]|uniref:Putative nuclease HARBI1 n=1 Tax=Sipha flava TaxID=143950 RepID=A0A8B8F5B5_9HEMI|nr:putative nuclease HARBI1 [Sipha flava]